MVVLVIHEAILTAIGAIVLIAGLVLLAMRRRGWMMAVTAGALWLLAMGLYALYRAGGFYGPAGGLAAGSAGPLVTTILGFLIFFTGVGVLIYIMRKGGG